MLPIIANKISCPLGDRAALPTPQAGMGHKQNEIRACSLPLLPLRTLWAALTVFEGISLLYLTKTGATVQRGDSWASSPPGDSKQPVLLRRDLITGVSH